MAPSPFSCSYICETVIKNLVGIHKNIRNLEQLKVFKPVSLDYVILRSNLV